MLRNVKEERMLNIEYYKDKLMVLGVIDLSKLALAHGQLQRCDGDIKCDECLFNNNEFCSDEALNWLFSEYKEPEEVDWSKVKVDTPILVKDCKDSEIWIRRYFSKFEDGKVYVWSNGATSWTADNEYGVTSWNYARLAESEE